MRSLRSFRHRAPRLRLDRPGPVSETFGLDRGTPVDRYYIRRFLSAQAERIRGRVLEIGDDTYVREFGTPTQVDVLHAEAGNPHATIVGDLQDAQTLVPGTFDCIVLIQTLQMVPDPRRAITTCRAALAPGGCILATLPGISQVSRYDMDRWGDFWRFTDRGARELLASAFSDHEIDVSSHGNVATACAFLQGLAVEELDPAVLAVDHRDYPLLVSAIATRT